MVPTVVVGTVLSLGEDSGAVSQIARAGDTARKGPRPAAAGPRACRMGRARSPNGSGAGESRPHATNCVRPCVLVRSCRASFAPGPERGRGCGVGCAGRGAATWSRGGGCPGSCEEGAAPRRWRGGAKSCRRRSPSCLGGADSPSGGLWATGHLGIKLPPESMTEGIGGAFSSGCIVVGAASVPRAWYLVSFDMPGARGLPARILVHTRPVPP